MGRKKAQQRQVYWLECRRHAAVLLPDSVRRRPHSALRCQACRGKGSQLWRKVLADLQLCVVGLGLLAFECNMLAGVQKRFDIYLVEHGLAIEVDGAQHFEGSYRGVPWQVQWLWDRAVDAACKQQGLRLVRLHYKDTKQWATKVQAALGSQQPVTYTKSYGV